MSCSEGRTERNRERHLAVAPVPSWHTPGVPGTLSAPLVTAKHPSAGRSAGRVAAQSRLHLPPTQVKATKRHHAPLTARSQPVELLATVCPACPPQSFRHTLSSSCKPPRTAMWCASRGEGAPANLRGGRPASRRASGLARLTLGRCPAGRSGQEGS